MTRDWQPGPAMIRQGDKEGNFDAWQVGFRDGYNGAWVSRERGRLSDSGPWVIEARPLAVIDPENREQVEGLVKSAWPNGHLARDVDALQAALREFADPKSRIEEPGNFGAIVIDDNEAAWSKRADGQWNSADGDIRFYAEITPVRVLSEGVQ